MSENYSGWNTFISPPLCKASCRFSAPAFMWPLFKYFDNAFCIGDASESSLRFRRIFFMIDCKGRNTEGAGDRCKLQRRWVNASEAQNVEFRCMVTDGKPCRNPKKCFYFPVIFQRFYQMQMKPVLQNWWPKKQRQTQFKSSLPSAPLLEKTTAVDCFTCLCWAHSFLGAGKRRAADSKQSSVKWR